MVRFVLQRLGAIVPIGIGVIVLVSLLAHAVPGDPVDSILGEYATAADKDALRHQLGLDQPVILQIVTYFQKILHLDFGSSLITQRSVTSLIGERWQATTELAICSILAALLISFPLGILAALYAGKPIDFVAMFCALLGVCMPTFWLGSMLILIFSLKLDLLPVSERQGLSSYILPATTMGFALAAMLSRMLRNSMLENLNEDYVRTARAKGLSEWSVIGKHVLRNAALPLVTVIGLQFGVILTGAVITEVIFDWPGLGSLMLEAVRSRDYPLMQGLVLLFSATYLIVNLATDISYGLIDPRIRLGKR